MRHFDLCVIGSGPAGQKAAIQASKLGKSVCVVERREAVGGASINTGTIPSKALREAILKLAGRQSAMPREEDFRAARSAVLQDLLSATYGVINAEIEIVSRQFQRNGVRVIRGEGHFVDRKTLEVKGQHATEPLTADHFVIAVGTQPSKPADIPFDDRTIVTSDEILRLPELPRTIIVVGGGVIGAEYASMLAAMGVRVTLIEGRPRLLDFVDAEIIEALQYQLRQSGMTLRMGERVVKIGNADAPAGARTSNGHLVEALLESGKTLRADALLYAVGRQGATEGLNLAAAGLTADDRGRITVNQFFQTAAEHIYACGDVIGFPALASTSMEQGRLSAVHMFGGTVQSTAELLPYGIYAIPEISMVGWTEERLTKEGVPYEAGIAQYKEIARGQLLGDETGMLKMLIHQESHAVLGVHVIGTGATELIHIGQAVMAHQGTAEYFVDTVFNYPTLAECYKVAALNGLNKLKNM
ncbi:MAG: Si-specific NAD(P)(+) transhydrogenase [Phycisphaerales bacterium]